MNKFLIVEAEAYLNGEIANTTLVNLTGNIFTVSNSACEDINCAECHHYTPSKCKNCFNGYALTED